MGTLIELEKAIKGLKAFRKEFSGYEPNEEMFDMAIKALEQEPKIDLDKLKRKILMEVDGGTDDKWLRYGDVCDRISDSIDEYKAEIEPQENYIEKRKPCINYEDGCEEWAGCPCVYYKAESEDKE